MTNQPQEQIEDIRKACIAANADITKLQFGCRLLVKGRGDYRNTMLFIDHSVAGNLICTPCVKGAGTTTVKPENAEIIGRDIRLADVLLAIREHRFVKAQSIVRNEKIEAELEAWLSTKEGTSWHPLYWEKGVLSHWNLRSDRLQDQSEKTIAFIHSLLKV